jgi:N-acyl-D-amino-acid deacylase
MHRLLPTVFALGCAAVLVSALQPASFDVLIVNGRVLDGSGAAPKQAAVGIRDGRIVSIGALPGAAAVRTIDAGGRIVAPGFIDVHSHAAETLTRPELRQAQPILAQGVTTIVVNPDGGGPIDLAKQRVELERGGVGPNVALLIGHGRIRDAVVGGAARAPTDQELARMQDIVRRGMEDGAFGLSSGLYYLPGSHARTEELIALARVAGELGGVYTSHIRDESDYNVGLVAAVEEVIRIADEGRLTGIVSHMKALGPASWGLSSVLIERIERARARGVRVFADQYPYEASSLSLRAALLPGAADLPANRTPAAGSGPDARLSDAELATLRENLKRRGGPASIVIAFFRPDRSLEGKSLAQIGAATRRDPEEVAMDLISRGGASIVSFNMSEDDIERIMRQPWTMTSSDGGLVAPGAGKPHPRNNGAFARKLARYVRERRTVPLEFAVRSMTSLPAEVFAIKDRGALREGAWADIAVFDPAAVQDRATYADPHQLAAGMAFVLVNGQLVVDGGRFTLALPGKVLRR